MTTIYMACWLRAGSGFDHLFVKGKPIVLFGYWSLSGFFRSDLIVCLPKAPATATAWTKRILLYLVLLSIFSLIKAMTFAPVLEAM